MNELEGMGRFDVIDQSLEPTEGRRGLYALVHKERRPQNPKEYKKIAEQKRFRKKISNPDEVEKLFWRNANTRKMVYCPDVNQSLMDHDLEECNFQKLGTTLDLLQESGTTIAGVNTPNLYFGSWGTTTPWHCDDMDLYSIYYLHDGHAKTWYTIPPSHHQQFESIAAALLPEEAEYCHEFLRHKLYIFDPSILKKHKIPFEKVIQEKGEIVVFFPRCYHAGFDHGFNISEGINFASERWIPIGKRSTRCKCQESTVDIPMDIFEKKRGPE
ncbi:Hypothetical predicted protein [Cloeon dipterum]|nr:Hypothetical predicted protein [Cloeon dipterum]